MGKTDQIANPVVLLGGGHAHIEVIRLLGSMGLSRKIILVSPSRYAPYSGMLPGYIAGHYRFEDFHIDLAALCERSGAIFVESAAVNIDPDRQHVSLIDDRILRYTILSLDIGSTPSLPPGGSGGVSVKPIASFVERLTQLDRLGLPDGRAIRLAVIGQGVAGVEVAFALKRRLEALLRKGSSKLPSIEIALVGRSRDLVPERSPLARNMLMKELRRAGIAHYPNFDVLGIQEGALIARDGRRLVVNEAVWTTSSGAPGWLRKTGLQLDVFGFIRVDKMLRAVSHPTIFAAGDVASLPDPRPKAGVFAVRQGPVLAENIRRTLSAEPLLPFRPQRAWLALISLADGRAIADKWSLAVSGRWVCRWKHWNDTRFVHRYRS